MNAAQAGSVTATFAYVSELLTEVLRLARGEVTPFDRQRRDISRLNAVWLEDFVGAFRGQMLEALSRLDIPAPMSGASSRWSVQTALLYCDVALSELTPRHLRAYGAIGDAEAEEVARVAGELRERIAEARAVLDGRGPG